MTLKQMLNILSYLYFLLSFFHWTETCFFFSHSKQNSIEVLTGRNIRSNQNQYGTNEQLEL